MHTCILCMHMQLTCTLHTYRVLVDILRGGSLSPCPLCKHYMVEEMELGQFLQHPTSCHWSADLRRVLNKLTNFASFTNTPLMCGWPWTCSGRIMGALLTSLTSYNLIIHYPKKRNKFHLRNYSLQKKLIFNLMKWIVKLSWISIVRIVI
jgi:hypothetical protein